MSMLTKEMDRSPERKDPRMNLHIKKRKAVKSSRQLSLLELPTVATEKGIAHVKNSCPESETRNMKEAIVAPVIVSAILFYHP